MNKGLWFIFGVCAGSICTWLYLKNKYEYEVEEVAECDPLIEDDSKMHKKEDSFETSTNEAISATDAVKNFKNSFFEKPSLDEYVKEIDKRQYSIPKDIYVISPKEFGEIDDYERITLTYYSDKVLTDEDDEIIDDIDDTVGEDFADHFGEYEEDSVYVRNDVRNCDYEILMDLRRYKDVLKTKPKPVEVE